MCDPKKGDYQDALDGDVYWNPVFGDLWIVEGCNFVLINDIETTPLDGVVGFVKVGHLDGVARPSLRTANEVSKRG